MSDVEEYSRAEPDRMTCQAAIPDTPSGCQSTITQSLKLRIMKIASVTMGIKDPCSVNKGMSAF